jgi:5-methylcytosine-specific restriction enzyme A
MTTRIRLTRAQKVRVFDGNKGRCYLCGLKIHAQRGEQWHCEHRIPLWAGGADTLENMAPAHLDCHAEKTSGEAAGRAKELRMRANHLGIPKPGKKLPGGRHSDKTITMGKGVQPRRSGAQKHAELMERLYPWGIPE